MQGAIFELPREVNLGLADSSQSKADYAIAFVNNCEDVERFGRSCRRYLTGRWIVLVLLPEKKFGSKIGH